MHDLIRCPECARQLRLPEGFAGQQVRCPGCSATFRTERPSQAIQEDPPAPPDRRVQDRPAAPAVTWPGRDEPFEGLRRRDRLPDELPGGAVAVALVVLLALSMADSLLQIGVASVRLQQVNRPHDPMVQQGAEDDFLPTACLPAVVLLPTAVLFSMWMYRSYKNLQEMGVRGLRYSPGWAAGAFFVPILNLFRPFQIAQEMWRASGPLDRDDALAWRDRRGSGLISLWWALWIISGIVGYAAFPVAVGPGEAETSLTASMISEALSILAALSAIGMIRGLGKRQARLLEELKLA